MAPASYRVDRPMGDHFFAAVFLEGNLHIHGIPERGPWDFTKLRWLTERELDAVLVPAAGDRRIRTRADLNGVLMEPKRPAPTHQIWIHESLLDDARRLWERARAAQAADDHA
jgi:hypothetical protein